MAPCWPGTALLTTKAPRKLVFLFTLSLSVTYLFYSLLSCYNSLQFPLQDTGIYLQPEPGISPVDAIRTASLKPDTSSRDYYRDRQPDKSYVKSSDGSRDFILKHSGIRGVSALVSSSIPASSFRYSKLITGRQPSYTDLSQPDLLSPTLRTRVPLIPDIHSSPDGAGAQELRVPTVTGSDSSIGSDSQDSIYIGSTAESVSSLDKDPFSYTNRRVSSLDKDPDQIASILNQDHIRYTDRKINNLDKDPIPFRNQRVSTLDKNPVLSTDLVFSDRRVSSLDKDPIPFTDQRVSSLDKDSTFTDLKVSTLDKDPFTDRRVSNLNKDHIPFTNQRVNSLDKDSTFTDWRVSSLDKDPIPYTLLSSDINYTKRRFSTSGSVPVTVSHRGFSTLERDPVRDSRTLDSTPIEVSEKGSSTLDRAPIRDISTLDGAPIEVSDRGFSTFDRAPIRDISTLDRAPIRDFSTLKRVPIETSNKEFSTLDNAPIEVSERRFSTLDSAPIGISDRGFRTLDRAHIGDISTSDRAHIGDISTSDRAHLGDFSTSDRAHIRDFSTLDNSFTGLYPSFSTLDSSPISSFSTSNISPAPSSSYSIPVIPTHHRTSTSDNSPVSSVTQKISPPDLYLSNNIIDHPSIPGLSNQQPHLTDGQTTTDSTATSSLASQPDISSTAGFVSYRDSVHSYQEAEDTSKDPIREQIKIPGVNSGERLLDFPGNAMRSPLPGVPSWDRTPLAATEMIPESHTGYLERDPQESSTTDDDLSRRIMVNSTVEYGDKRLPQAIIIGVKKGGTRALLEALRAHPDVRAVGVEPHFFDRNYEKGLEWYRDLMPRTIEGQITMEKTPSYFVTNEAPQRIYSMAKDTKLIVVVRNPVTRAISDYTQTLSKKPEIPTFEVLAFKNRTLGLIDASWSALRIGIYALHLESWMQFFPLSQILFVSGERLITNPAEELAKVQDFLGLQRIITDKYFYFNKTKGFPCLKKPEDTGAPRCLGKSKGRTHPKIDPDVIQRLRKFYKPFNAMFYQMTGQDFQWEKEELEG